MIAQIVTALSNSKIIGGLFGIVAVLLFAAVVIAGFFGRTLPADVFDLLTRVIWFSLGGVTASTVTAGATAVNTRVQAQLKARIRGIQHQAQYVRPVNWPPRPPE